MEIDGIGMSAAEILAMIEPSHGNRWGKWEYDEELKVLRHDSMRWYEVDVERMQTAAACLDWIFQVSKKPVVSREDVGDLIAALRVIVDPQGKLCSFAM